MPLTAWWCHVQRSILLVPGSRAPLARVGSVFQPHCAAPAVPRDSAALRAAPREISQATPGHSGGIHFQENFRRQVLRAKYQQCLLLSSGAGAAGSCRVSARAAHRSSLPHGPGDRKTIHEEQPFNVLRIGLCNGSIVSSHQADMKI